MNALAEVRTPAVESSAAGALPVLGQPRAGAPDRGGLEDMLAGRAARYLRQAHGAQAADSQEAGRLAARRALAATAPGQVEALGRRTILEAARLMADIRAHGATRPQAMLPPSSPQPMPAQSLAPLGLSDLGVGTRYAHRRVRIGLRRLQPLVPAILVLAAAWLARPGMPF